MSNIIRIGTRKSALALKQTRLIAEQLKHTFPEVEIKILTRDTLGDKILDSPLQAFGGKGVFVSEFEQALLEDRMDLAVHSAKDMPMELAKGLVIAAVSEREDPRDVLVTCRDTLLFKKKELLIGTSSPRRQLQIRQMKGIWPGETTVCCETLRGNLQTRLEKLKSGAYDGIILAAAGLKRLGIEEGEAYRFYPFETADFIPAGGQGIMAVEAREGSAAARMCKAIDHREARMCLQMERSILSRLKAGCHEPIGVFAELHGREGYMEVRGISCPKGEIRRIHIRGGLSPEEQLALSEQAGKGLV